jgi:hypothetical protein
MQQLFQDDPYSKCIYIPKDRNGNPRKNRSFTDSRESYQNGACKETLILRRNGRIPTQEFVLHFLTVWTAEEIRALRTEIFSYLSDNELQAVANIELTRGDDGLPNNTVHFHIITDDPRSEEELRELIETASERQGLVKDEDFCITYEYLPYGYWRFNYFTKYGKKYFNIVILFEKELLESGRTLQKFYTIGQWFKKGRGKGKIWDEIKAECQKKHRIDLDDPNNGKDNDLADIDNELPNDPAPEECTVTDLHDDFVECEGWLNAMNLGGVTRRTRNIRINPDDIPTKTSIDFDRKFMLTRYGIDIDEVTGGNEAITRLFALSVGKFRKYPEAGWYCMDEFKMLCKPVQRARADTDKSIIRIPGWNERPQDCYLLLPRRGYKDRRHEWQRFRYSIAFRQ